MLFVVGAMAALSIDVVTFYTARSEAQLAADAGALAGARALANSGVTSDTNAPGDGMLSAAQLNLAKPVAIQVAQSNLVGGQTVPTGQIQVSFNGTGSNPCAAVQAGQPNNPCVTVQVTAYLPTFFARIWGNTQVTISATATAEAYNPSGLATNVNNTVAAPIAPSCVKPWLLPNLDPNGTGAIFDKSSGAIQDSALLGWETPVALGGNRLKLGCPLGNCGTQFPNVATAWRYFPGDTTSSFPPPPATSVTCAGSDAFTAYELSVAGCVQTPIACNDNSTIKIDLSDYGNRNTETADAANCLAHTSTGRGDKVNETNPPFYPFEFVAGADNPLVEAGSLSAGKDVVVSDSLVTVPVFDSSTWPPPEPVQIIGLVQLFLSPEGQPTNTTSGNLHTMVINMVGCGTNLNGGSAPPIYGNGATAVPVRLISPP